MNVIVEGCDLSGKTSVVNALVNRGYQAEHFSLPKDEADWRSHLIKIHDLASRGGRWVFDREPGISNTIYRPIFNHPYSISRRHLFGHLNKYPENTIILWMNPTESMISTRFDLRGDPYLDLNKIMLAKSLYESLFYGYHRLGKFYKCQNLPQVVEVSRSDTCSEGLRLVRLYEDIVLTQED